MMDKSLFEKYINEMKEFKKRSTLPLPAAAEYEGAEREDATELNQNEERLEPNLANGVSNQEQSQMTGKGYLIVSVTSARELYPVRNAKITVFTGNNEDRKIFAEGVTDISGKAGPFELKAPNILYSESPSSEVLPFAYYNVLTEADNFASTIHLGVQVFDKVTSIQNVNLFSADNRENTTIIVNEKEAI